MRIVLFGASALWSLVASSVAVADVLTLHGDPTAIEAAREAIAPVELQIASDGAHFMECIVLEVGDVTTLPRTGHLVIALSPDRAKRSEPVRIDPLHVTPLLECDTFADLQVLFGAPEGGVGVGSRRHVRSFEAFLRAPKEADVDPSDGAFDGTVALSLLSRAGRFTWSPEAQATWLAGGGTLANRPHPWSDTLDFTHAFRPLAATVALDRRTSCLEPGFERAAVGMMAAVLGAVDQRDTPLADALGAQAVPLVDHVLQRIDMARPGFQITWDPAVLRPHAQAVRQASTPAELAAAVAAFDAAFRDLPPHEPAGRKTPSTPSTAVDPSELAAIWIDIVEASGLLGTDGPGARRLADGLVSRFLLWSDPLPHEDPRSRDRVRIWPRMLALAPRLFDRTAAAEDPAMSERFELLWRSVLAHSMRSEALTSIQIQQLAAAGWCAPEKIAERTTALLEKCESLLVTALREETRADGDAERAARARASLAQTLRLLDAWGKLEAASPADPHPAMDAWLGGLDARLERLNARGEARRVEALRALRAELVR